jgi:hypothetical protein
MDWTNWTGAIVGSLVGLAGGIAGTAASIYRARPGAERRYVVRWSAYFWAGVTAFLALLFLLPFPYGFLLWVPYPFLLVWSIRRANAGFARLRADQGEAGA